MNACGRSESMDSIAEVVEAVRKKSVQLWLDDGILHYKAPKGALSGDELAQLASLSEQIAMFLARSGGQPALPPLGPRRPTDRIPLAYSQLKYWRSDRLHERSTIRTIVSATQAQGQLRVDILRDCIAHIVARHEALRTRIVVMEGLPVQHIEPHVEAELLVDDLSALPASEFGLAVDRIIHERILHPVRVTNDLLFEFRLLKVRTDEHILVVLLEHIISDAVSMNVLLRDLFTAYAQVSAGRPLSLPPIPIQFADYAVWQARAEPAWLQVHGAYWKEHLAGCRRLRMPNTGGSQAADPRIPVIVPVRIESDLRERIATSSRARGTTVAMSIFTAFVGLVLRWSSVSEAVVRYQTDGRFSPLVENSIGYFAAVLNLKVRLLDSDTFLDLLRQVTREYCESYEHTDLSYLDTQVPPAEFTRNPGFNFVARGVNVGFASPHPHAAAVTWQPRAFSYPSFEGTATDYEPMILLYDYGTEIAGNLFFPPTRFSAETARRFAGCLVDFVRELVEAPRQRVVSIALR
jgi:hypothetical protein